MRDGLYLGEFEQLVLLAVLRHDRHAAPAIVRDEIAARAVRHVSRGAVYITLDRLETKGLLISRLADATAARGGRPRRYYALTRAGAVALRESRTALSRMWDGLEPRLARSGK